MPCFPVRRLLIAAILVCAVPLSGAEPDAAGPKGAMKFFYQALEAGDAATIRASFYTKTDAERELADAFAAELTAAKALGEAAKAKFAATGDALTKGLPARDQLASLDKAQVTIDGDNASIKLAGQNRPLRMIRADGRWQLSIADYANANAENVAAQTAVLKDMANVFAAVAADISADKFSTAQDAQRVLQQRLQAVLFNALQKNPPTTRPAAAATAPAKR